VGSIFRIPCAVDPVPPTVNQRVGKTKIREELEMTRKQLRNSGCAVAMVAASLVTGMLLNARRVQADQMDREESRIRRGFEIAPVPLNLAGKNRALVGLGSYIVNAQADCDGCHSAGPQSEFAPGGNPYFGQPTKVNPETYLGGGRDFGRSQDPVHFRI
jgi:hypothetical protein